METFPSLNMARNACAILRKSFASKVKYLIKVVAIIVKKKKKTAQGEGLRSWGCGLKRQPICAVKERNHEKYNKVGSNFVSS